MYSNSELELGLKRQRTIPSLQEGRDTKEISELVDIISPLPNHVIERVLSCLETKEAIRTCVLSSRWRNLWKSITCIQLEGYRSDSEKFSNLVEHVLQNCSSTDFLAFELGCALPIDLSRLNTWIGSIVSHKFKRLVLCANYSHHMDYELPELPLPQFIVSCTTLVLESALSYTWPTFPYLRTLIMHSSAFSGWACFSKILHCAPFLEFLVLDLEGINDVDNRPSGDQNALYQWTEPNTVPKCLEHLEIIGIQYFKGHKDELQVVEYLLKNAEVLEHILIAYESEYRSEEAVQKLLMSPRASKSCEVEIY